MNFVRKALSALGGVVLVAALIAAFTPKATHGVVAALVQIVSSSASPVITLGAEKLPSSMITFLVNSAGCYTVAGTTTAGCPPPASNALFILTDYSWYVSGCGPTFQANQYYCQFAISHLNLESYDITGAFVDANGIATGNVHLTTGIPIHWSGQTLDLTLTTFGNSSPQGAMWVHGYYAPNE